MATSSRLRPRRTGGNGSSPAALGDSSGSPSDSPRYFLPSLSSHSTSETNSNSNSGGGKEGERRKGSATASAGPPSSDASKGRREVAAEGQGGQRKKASASASAGPTSSDASKGRQAAVATSVAATGASAVAAFRSWATGVPPPPAPPPVSPETGSDELLSYIRTLWDPARRSPLVEKGLLTPDQRSNLRPTPADLLVLRALPSTDLQHLVPLDEDGEPTSVGSFAHECGDCIPCIYRSRGLCVRGMNCDFCHVRHSTLKCKRPRPPKHVRERLRRREGAFNTGEDKDVGEDDNSGAAGATGPASGGEDVVHCIAGVATILRL